jgi:ribosome-associated protein
VRATAEFAVEEGKRAGVRPIGVEGLSTSKWVLVDYGDVIFHMFLEELRSYYDMDGLWADAPRIDAGLEREKLKEVEPT